MATSVMTLPMHASQSHAAPASRASWCGQLRLGDLCVPVKAYAAIATPPETPLRQLHDVCGQRIEYRKWCPTHGAVPTEEIIKGYPYQPDQYVRLSADELETLQPEDDKTVHLKYFMVPSLIDLVLFAGRVRQLLTTKQRATFKMCAQIQTLSTFPRSAFGVARPARFCWYPVGNKTDRSAARANLKESQPQRSWLVLRFSTSKSNPWQSGTPGKSWRITSRSNCLTALPSTNDDDTTASSAVTSFPTFLSI